MIPNELETQNLPIPLDSNSTLRQSKLVENQANAMGHNFVSSKRSVKNSGRVGINEYQSNQLLQQQNLYSSHESNIVFSDNQSGSALPNQQRGKQRNNIEPSVFVHSKESYRGHSTAGLKDNAIYQGALGLNRHGVIQNARIGVSEVRANKLQKNAYDKKKDWQAFPVKVQNLNQMVQIRKKKPKLKYYDKLQIKAQQERQIYSQQVQHRSEPKRLQKILDGFLLLFSCRVKLPHEAIRSKLSGENIVDVREEDLVYFKQNLKYLDISDNSIYMEQLVNLLNLEELDIQYNNLDHLELQEGVFPQLQVLNLSYNKIPTSHLQELQYLNKLRVLEVASNDLCTLPSDLSFFKVLEEINLSSNNFSTDSVLVNPSKLFAAMATIPNLKKLNLSRNRFKAFHSEELPQDNLNQEEQSQVFPNLVELNFSFNLVESEDSLMYCVTQLPSLLYLIVTGNPFAIKGDPFSTATLEQILNSKNGKLINDTLQPPTYLRQKSKKQDGRPPMMLNYNFPQSRELAIIKEQNFGKQVMHQEAEDLFPMPSKDQQIHAIEYQQDQLQSDEDEEQDQQNDNKFFITEDEMLRGNKKQQKPQSRQYQPDNIIQEENNDPNINQDLEDDTQQYKQQYQKQQVQDRNDDDFGRQKMDKFKEQCRLILGQNKKDKSNMYNNPLYQEFEDDMSQDSQFVDNSQYVKARDYDSYLDIINAYKTLKQFVNKPSTVHNPVNQGGSKGYLKMTIAATQHSKSKMNRDLLEYSLGHKHERVASTAVGGQRAIMQHSSFDSNDQTMNQNRFMNKRPTWRKSKQEVIDEKVERLFESYKMMDEVTKKQMALQGIQERENNKQRNKYFPDDDEDDEE